MCLKILERKYKIIGGANDEQKHSKVVVLKLSNAMTY